MMNGSFVCKEKLVAWKLIPVTAAALLLAGCAGTNTLNASSGSASGGDVQPCDAEKAESAVGQRANSGLVEQYRRLANAKTARPLRPHDVMTMEYDPTRLNLRLDDNDVVISVNCS